MADIATTPRACPKDCRMCGMVQQVYCATNLTFKSFEVMKGLHERLDAIEVKLQNMQSAEELVTPETEPIR